MTEVKSYTTIDKTSWERGPWDQEPDKLQWVDPATDLDCLIVRNYFGGLCGYVGVSPEHPYHGRKDYNEIDVGVHGGLTYADACQEGMPESESICHIPLPGRSPDMWWFGFDCGHAWDLQPGMIAFRRATGVVDLADVLHEDVVYRDINYVRTEVERLAEQLAEVAA